MRRQTWRAVLVLFLVTSTCILLIEFSKLSPRLPYDENYNNIVSGQGYSVVNDDNHSSEDDEKESGHSSATVPSPSTAELLIQIRHLKEKVKQLQLDLHSYSKNQYSDPHKEREKTRPGEAQPSAPLGSLSDCSELVGRKVGQSEILRGISFNNEYEVESFSYFTPSKIYSSQLAFQRRVVEKPSGNRRKDLNEVVRTAKEHLTRMHGKKFGMDDFVEGDFRNMPTVGTEYGLSFIEPQVNGSSPPKYYRIKLLRPMASVSVVQTEPQNRKKLINIVLPLSGRLKRFKIFMEMLTNLILRKDKRIFLSIVYFGQEGLQSVRNIITASSKASGFRHIKLLTVNETFSRGKALQVGAMHWSKGDVLLFMCDVDVVFSTRFLDRCRYHTTRGQSVYYPIVFSLYNPSVIYPLQHKPVPSEMDQLTISKESGFWRDFGYGMTCQYRSDFRTMQGFNENIVGWGGEDVYLYRKYVKSNLKVVRAPDPGLIHIWHYKNCSTNLNEEQYKSCLNSRVLNEASHVQLGSIIYKTEFEKHQKQKNEKDREGAKFINSLNDFPPSS